MGWVPDEAQHLPRQRAFPFWPYPVHGYTLDKVGWLRSGERSFVQSPVYQLQHGEECVVWALCVTSLGRCT